ncbi:two-component system response regulator, partial [bacterium F16]
MDSSDLRILIVDDEEQALKSFSWTMETAGYSNLMTCQVSADVLEILDKHEFDVVILDLMMPKPSGEELLPVISSKYPHIPIIVVTGVNEIESAVECLQLGASDYLVKPVDRERLIASLSKVFEIASLRQENVRLSQAIISDNLNNPGAFSRVITRTPAIQRIFQYCEAVAKGKSPILITGDTGVGKSILAEAIHTVSDRSGNYVNVNIAGFDDQHFSDALFGHAKGAFTGALENRPGLIESAVGGTLFL